MNTLSTTFYIVRHGQSDGNIRKIIQGQSDSHLTELGKQQALHLVDELKYVNFDAVFSSDSIRAKETAEIIAIDKKIMVQESALLREHAMGQWEGSDEKDYYAAHKDRFEKYQELSEQEKWKSKIPDDVESDEEVNMRFMKFARGTAHDYPGKTVLVVTHGGVMRCLLVYLGWGNHEQLPVGVVENTACIQVKTDGVDFVIKDIKGILKHTSREV